MNRDATIALVRAAAEHGAESFVFLGSIGVNGADSGRGAVHRDEFALAARAICVFKLEAEQSDG